MLAIDLGGLAVTYLWDGLFPWLLSQTDLLAVQVQGAISAADVLAPYAALLAIPAAIVAARMSASATIRAALVASQAAAEGLAERRLLETEDLRSIAYGELRSTFATVASVSTRDAGELFAELSRRAAVFIAEHPTSAAKLLKRRLIASAEGAINSHQIPWHRRLPYLPSLAEFDEIERCLYRAMDCGFYAYAIEDINLTSPTESVLPPRATIEHRLTMRRAARLANKWEEIRHRLRRKQAPTGG